MLQRQQNWTTFYARLNLINRIAGGVFWWRSYAASSGRGRYCARATGYRLHADMRSAAAHARIQMT